MKISAVVMTYNEEKNIPDLIRNLKDCDEIIIADGGSTDKTRNLAERYGATVFVRSPHIDIATAEDVQAFKEKFGWLPAFNGKRNMLNMGEARNEAITQAKHEWVFMPDADERVTWDMNALKKEMEVSDQIACKFINSRNKDGTPAQQFDITKLSKKELMVWKNRVHEVVMPSGRVAKTTNMRINHFQPKNHTQPQVQGVLEYSVIKENDQRSKFYLGREYNYVQQFDRSIAMLEDYLKEAKWIPEIVEARYLIAKGYWNTMQGDKARETCLLAVRDNPDHKNALLLMSEMYNEPWKHIWYKIYLNAKGENSLFDNHTQ